MDRIGSDRNLTTTLQKFAREGGTNTGEILKAAREDGAFRHSKDSDCTINPATDACIECGVVFGDPCPDCGGRGYHNGWDGETCGNGERAS